MARYRRRESCTRVSLQWSSNYFIMGRDKIYFQLYIYNVTVRFENLHVQLKALIDN